MAPCLLLFVLAASPPVPTPLPLAPPIPECRTSDGKSACGFHCKSGLGNAKCAQTPEGFCMTIDTHVVCWDPPEAVRQHPPKTPIAPTCRSKYREIVCGYTCETSPTKIACTSTPYGACLSKFDSVKCWDPSERVIHLNAPNLPNARCMASLTEIACGYDCKSSYQQVACAQTPGGRCLVDSGKVGCWDPPLPSSPGHVH